MSDIAPAEPPAAPAPPVAPPAQIDSPPVGVAAPTPPASTPPAAVEPPAFAADDPLADDVLDYGQQQFPRSVVEKLRKEAGARRIAAQEAQAQLAQFTEAFDGLTSDDQQALLGFVKTLKADPIAGAEWMETTAGQLKQQFAQAQAAIDGQAPTPDGQPAANDPNRPMTIAEFERIQAAQAQAAQQATMIDHWNREAVRLGYDPRAQVGTVPWLQFQQLVKMAETTQGDLGVAHTRLIEVQQQAAAAHAQAHVEAARGQVAGMPVAPGGSAAPTERPLSDSQKWARHDEAIKQRLAGDAVT